MLGWAPGLQHGFSLHVQPCGANLALSLSSRDEEYITSVTTPVMAIGHHLPAQLLRSPLLRESERAGNTF